MNNIIKRMGTLAIAIAFSAVLASCGEMNKPTNEITVGTEATSTTSQEITETIQADEATAETQKTAATNKTISATGKAIAKPKEKVILPSILPRPTTTTSHKTKTTTTSTTSQKPFVPVKLTMLQQTMLNKYNSDLEQILEHKGAFQWNIKIKFPVEDDEMVRIVTIYENVIGNGNKYLINSVYDTQNKGFQEDAIYSSGECVYSKYDDGTTSKNRRVNDVIDDCFMGLGLEKYSENNISAVKMCSTSGFSYEVHEAEEHKMWGSTEILTINTTFDNKGNLSSASRIITANNIDIVFEMNIIQVDGTINISKPDWAAKLD